MNVCSVIQRETSGALGVTIPCHHTICFAAGQDPNLCVLTKGVYALRSRTHAVRVRVLMGRKGRPESRNVVAQGMSIRYGKALADSSGRGPPSQYYYSQSINATP